MRDWKRSAIILAAAASLMMNTCVWGEAVSSYAFTTGTVKIEAGQEWNKARKVLGKENSSKILVDCVNGENMVTYIYDDCEIKTAKNIKKKTIIESISLKGDAVTEEGLSLGQTSADVKRLYPDAKEEQGLYTAQLGDTSLVIDCGVENKKVVTITYEFTGKR